MSTVPGILARAAVAARIVAAIGNRDDAAPRPGRTSDATDGRGGLPRDPSEDDMVRYLEEIAATDRRWDLFAMGALGLQPGTESCNTVRQCLRKGFRKGAWEEGLTHLVSSVSAGENDRSPAFADLSATGMIEQRARLWLTYPNYFETLFSAVREKSLPKNMGLYTSELLIKYLGTIE